NHGIPLSGPLSHSGHRSGVARTSYPASRAAVSMCSSRSRLLETKARLGGILHLRLRQHVIQNSLGNETACFQINLPTNHDRQFDHYASKLEEPRRATGQAVHQHVNVAVGAAIIPQDGPEDAESRA